MVDKPKLFVIEGTQAPDTPKEQVRKRLRSKNYHMPECPRCAGHTFIQIQTGSAKQRVCFFCSMKGEMVVMT